ncbi:MAG: hypothetical protein JO191_02250 [Mycobacteriaceae bacterium]|nr:hypothetical protein [Mycobacteriaceae bacterium]
MTTEETPMVSFRRIRKHHRSAWGHHIGNVRVAVPAPEPVTLNTNTERVICR